MLPSRSLKFGVVSESIYMFVGGCQSHPPGREGWNVGLERYLHLNNKLAVDK